MGAVDLTEEAARPRFAGAGLPDWLAMQLAGVFGVIRDGGFARTTDTIRAVTGRPARGIADFMPDVATAFTPAEIVAAKVAGFATPSGK